MTCHLNVLPSCVEKYIIFSVPSSLFHISTRSFAPVSYQLAPHPLSLPSQNGHGATLAPWVLCLCSRILTPHKCVALLAPRSFASDLWAVWEGGREREMWRVTDCLSFFPRSLCLEAITLFSSPRLLLAHWGLWRVEQFDSISSHKSIRSTTTSFKEEVMEGDFHFDSRVNLDVYEHSHFSWAYRESIVYLVRGFHINIASFLKRS